MPVTEHLSKAGDMATEVSLLNGHIGPYAGKQISVSNNFPRPLNKRHQDVERAPAERKQLVGLLQQPCGRKQTERPERNDLVRTWIVAIIHTRPSALQRS